MTRPARIVIIGGGIAGLAAAHALRDELPEANICILEAGPRVGGKLKTEIVESRSGGARFLVENGPNGVLDNQPHTLELAKRLRIEDRILGSSEDARRRYVYSRGGLRALPESPPAFIRCDLLSWRGKLRAAREWFVPRASRELAETESVAEFTIRRLGPEVLNTMIEPFVTGVFAGDPGRLELATAFPRMVQLESEYGGLLRALVSIERDKRRAARAGNRKPKTAMRSFRDGMGELAAALERNLGGIIIKNARARSILYERGSFRIGIDGREPVDADVAVVAAPAAEAAALLRGIADSAAREIQQIEYAPIAVVALGFEDAAARTARLDGFGFLVARGEKLRILGALCDTSIWPRGGGGFLVRCMIGGVRAPELLNLTDAELIEIARADLRAAAGLAAEPDLTRVVRWPAAIPQYTIGHARRVARIEKEIASVPGLYLAGAAYRGVSVNDLCRRAKEIAAEIAAAVRGGLIH
ncbi:MAG: protoporphyrinogen oxidase [Planctomycetes bacterium]|nr:protoporphyrinogen oxidase [Planctomycetota bacterium]